MLPDMKSSPFSSSHSGNGEKSRPVASYMVTRSLVPPPVTVSVLTFETWVEPLGQSCNVAFEARIAARTMTAPSSGVPSMLG